MPVVSQLVSNAGWVVAGFMLVALLFCKLKNCSAVKRCCRRLFGPPPPSSLPYPSLPPTLSLPFLSPSHLHTPLSLHLALSTQYSTVSTTGCTEGVNSIGMLCTLLVPECSCHGWSGANRYLHLHRLHGAHNRVGTNQTTWEIGGRHR